MPDKPEIMILRAFRPFQTILTIFKLNNFRSPNHHITRNIIRAIGFALLLFVYVFLFIASELSMCVQYNFNLNFVAQPLSFLIGGSQVFNIYVILIWKIDKVVEALEYFHAIVEARKGAFISFYSLRFPNYLENHIKYCLYLSCRQQFISKNGDRL